MALLTLQIGQCGNQVGQVLFSKINEDLNLEPKKTGLSKRSNTDYITEATTRWFHLTKNGKLEARSILIDTEDKVTLKVNKGVDYEFKHIIARCHGGAANNWAYGYGCKSNFLQADVVEAARNEAEKCDRVSSFMNIFSTSGGTGSGVGSKVIESLRDEFASKTIINVAVLPYANGDVAVQSYNTLLTLTKLYDVTDLCYVYENDILHRMCARMSSDTNNVTFRDINSMMAQQLVVLLQPVGNVSISRTVAFLGSHPGYKFVQVKSAPHVCKDYLKFEASHGWSMIVNRIKTLLARSNYNLHGEMSCSGSSKRLKSVGNLLVTRGGLAPRESDVKPLTDSASYVPWLPLQNRLDYKHQARNFGDLNKFGVLSSNNNGICGALKIIYDDARLLYNNGAYLHHYKKHNVDEDYFGEAFEKLQTIIRDYNEL